MNRASRLLWLVVLGFALSACAPGIYIKRYQPSRYNLGATRNVGLLGVMGPPEAIGVVMQELSQQVSSEGYFALYDATPKGVRLVFMPGQSVVIQNIEQVRAEVPAEVFVNATVTNWRYLENDATEKVAKDGQIVEKVYRVPRADTAVQFQVVQARTGRVVAVQEYSSSFDGAKYDPLGKDRPDVNALLRSSARQTVARFLADITPATVTDKIVLDDDEKFLEPGIELCKKGNLEAAFDAFSKALAEHPKSAGATYNLGVLYEAHGDYDQAAEKYKRAIELNDKDLYHDALNDMNRRIRDEERLKQTL